MMVSAVVLIRQNDSSIPQVVSCALLKISHLVASLDTNRQQVVFALLVTSCQQVWSNLLTTCNILADFVRLVTSLIQQICYNHDITILLQPCFINLVTLLLYRNCTGLVRTTLQGGPGEEN